MKSNPVALAVLTLLVACCVAAAFTYQPPRRAPAANPDPPAERLELVHDHAEGQLFFDVVRDSATGHEFLCVHSCAGGVALAPLR